MSDEKQASDRVMGLMTAHKPDPYKNVDADFTHHCDGLNDPARGQSHQTTSAFRFALLLFRAAVELCQLCTETANETVQRLHITLAAFFHSLFHKVVR